MQQKFETDTTRIKKIDLNRFKSVLIPLEIKTNSDLEKMHLN